MKQYISLENPLCGIGAYKDTLNLDTGATVRQIKKYEFTGNEYWTLNAGNFFSSCTDSDSKVFQTPVCSHLKGDTQIYISTGTVRLKVFISSLPQELQTLDAWKQYLADQYSAGTPVTVWYVLATPTTSTTALPRGLSGIVEGSLIQSGTPTPSSPIYPTANSIDAFLDKKYLKYGTSTDTITTLPKTIIADGQSASAVIKGNMQQSGTPTPTNPIYPQETGDKTANLFDCNQTNGITDNVFINAGGTIVSNNGYYLSYPIPVEPDSAYTWRFDSDVHVAHTAPTVGFYDVNHNFISAASHTGDVRYFSFTTPSNCKFVKASVYKTYKDEAMLNSGSTALPYEPYGYKIPISSANTTTPVYLGEVQTTRKIKKLVLTGQENFTARTNTSHSFQLPITRSADNSLSVSSHYKMISSNQIDVVTGFYAIGSFVLIITDLQYSNVTDFKTYLQQQYAAGTPVCVWYVLAIPTTGIVNEPIRKIGDYSDSVSGANLPTTGTAEQFDVDTTLKPSEVSLTYHGWHEHNDEKYVGG